MTIDTLFGEKVTSKPRTIKIKQIKAIYEKFTVNEQITNYLKTEPDSQHHKGRRINFGY